MFLSSRDLVYPKKSKRFHLHCPLDGLNMMNRVKKEVSFSTFVSYNLCSVVFLAGEDQSHLFFNVATVANSKDP